MNELTELKKNEIKGHISEIYYNRPHTPDIKREICEQIEYDYIFGEYATNEHYSRDEIAQLFDEFISTLPVPDVEDILDV